MQFRSPSSYIGSEVRVYKPHGSVNWVRVLEDAMGVDANNVAHSIIALGRSLTLAQGVHLDPEIEHVKFEERYVYPALALPANGKLDFECPKDHIDQPTSARRITSINRQRIFRRSPGC